VPVWIARADLIKKGYLPKYVPLYFDLSTPEGVDGLKAKCEKLQAEMLEWAGGVRDTVLYDGHMSTLFKVYETTEGSPYLHTSEDTQKVYSNALKKLLETVGDQKIADLCADDARGWFYKICKRYKKGYAAIIIAVFKQAVYYLAMRNDPDCQRLGFQLSKLRLETGDEREVELTYEMLVAFREVAHRRKRPSAALVLTFQFELGYRRRDVIGKWRNVRNPTTGALEKVWGDGFMWSTIDADGVLTWKASKTRRKKGKPISHRIASYPELAAELALIPQEARKPFAPIIINEKTGEPYRKCQFGRLFRSIAREAGIPDEVQCRDARSGSATEAGASGALDSDTMAHTGHASLKHLKRYDKRTLEKTERVAHARLAFRKAKAEAKALADAEQASLEDAATKQKRA